MALGVVARVGLGASSGLKSSVRPAKASRRVSVRATRRVSVVASADGFDRNWLKADPLVFVLGFAGWTVPSNIPVSGLGGASLFGKFTESIGQELAKFPQGPALGDDFWLYLITWHLGLFVALTLGQIGVQGRKQGYF
uniref:Photosystem I subunit PsaO n=1 Tax=Tetraselmis sp. GSL018 TaxID=582737 RepID=A0A061RKB7_9CHLO|eukprot:CAMPEP_0177582062 /NCGR_PEP_ID=MMETSP0419_2-20121207/2509_1 /TAXON_ID=582737 /ORGANISM="Tetraselmis sp., Strain GSL018" /LENGTH=137 /DNA_ID=CAMNT_0019071203 /DNA_START=107 /DNA_END=520 /DNA_ORIENTATION=+